MRLVTQQPSIVLVALAAWLLGGNNRAWAVGVFYADPGWRHVYHGDEAFYNDPDGPHPDYIGGANTNSPGGQAGTAALIFPGFVDPGCNPNTTVCAVDNASALWIHDGSQWEGSAPGDPLGGVPTGVPPIPPPAPGGVATYTEGATTYLRIQNAGNPQSWGWADKNAQASPTTARQEGNNRRIQFAHPLERIEGFGDDHAILDNGITISFRARIATAETGPLDMVYHENGPSISPPQPWPEIGVGHPIANNGRGMFILTQTGPTGPGQLAFSLVNSLAIGGSGVTPITEQTGMSHMTQTGLVMNNRASAVSTNPDTNASTPETLNIVEVDEMVLTDWQEFWITIQALSTPIDGNTHEVNVWHAGAEEPLEPMTFHMILGNENEFGFGAHVGMGLSSGTRGGAFDVDYYAYKLGVHAPTLNPMGLLGDFNDDGLVDAADYTVWRDSIGAAALPNDDDLGTVGQAHYELWKSQFGAMAPIGAVLAAVPEPASFLLALAGFIGVMGIRRRAFDYRQFPLVLPSTFDSRRFFTYKG